MALRNQPYIPLYVQDFLTDEKLNACKPSSQGVYIKIMCLFHKCDPYGGILLKQKDKQENDICLNFAIKLSNLLPFNLSIIHDALIDLLDEKVLSIENDFLYQKRMVNDNKISEIRSINGKKGGDNSLGLKPKKLLKQNQKQKHEDECENEDENINVFDEFRKLYLGIKRGNKTEFKNFQKHKDWKEVLPMLKNCLITQIEQRKKLKENGNFVPEWKHLQTWINQRCWEEILTTEETKQKTEKYKPSQW